MRVYISGAHSVGKTTLVKYISTKYNLPLLPEVARLVLISKNLQIDTLRIDLDVADDYQREVFNRQFIEEKKYESFVSDRNNIDTLCYSACHASILPELMKRKDLSEYIESLKKDDVYLFFVRPAKATRRNDGVRENPEWDGMVAIDAQLKFLFEMYDLKYFEINNDNMRSRTSIIDNILSIKNN